MGLLDMVEGQIAGGAAGSPTASATGGLIEELQNRPGGLGGLLQSFHQNGMGDQVQQWGQGQTAPASPDQIDQGLGGTGIIDSIAQKTGMSPATVKMGLGVAVPILIHHMVSNNHVTPQGEPGSEPMPSGGGLLQSVLGRLL